MDDQAVLNYDRIAQSISSIREKFQHQPSLEELAREVHLSPFHYQRMFQEWAGVSPKKFLQFTSIEYAKNLLSISGAKLSETAYETGLSGTSRLHDLFVSIEGMTPAEYRNGGAGLKINYGFSKSPFGQVLIASSSRGICRLEFIKDAPTGLSSLRHAFPNALISQQSDRFQEDALMIFNKDWTEIRQIKLHLHGTRFQLKVWEALLKIPCSQINSYVQLARSIEAPRSARAVGSAIGKNPVAYLIPCHRVIRSTGESGDYRWGALRKKMIIGWESTLACH